MILSVNVTQFSPDCVELCDQSTFAIFRPILFANVLRARVRVTVDGRVSASHIRARGVTSRVGEQHRSHHQVAAVDVEGRAGRRSADVTLLLRCLIVGIVFLARPLERFERSVGTRQGHWNEQGRHDRSRCDGLHRKPWSDIGSFRTAEQTNQSLVWRELSSE